MEVASERTTETHDDENARLRLHLSFRFSWFRIGRTGARRQRLPAPLRGRQWNRELRPLRRTSTNIDGAPSHRHLPRDLRGEDRDGPWKADDDLQSAAMLHRDADDNFEFDADDNTPADRHLPRYLRGYNGDGGRHADRNVQRPAVRYPDANADFYFDSGPHLRAPLQS